FLRLLVEVPGVPESLEELEAASPDCGVFPISLTWGGAGSVWASSGVDTFSSLEESAGMFGFSSLVSEAAAGAGVLAGEPPLPASERGTPSLGGGAPSLTTSTDTFSLPVEGVFPSIASEACRTMS